MGKIGTNVVNLWLCFGFVSDVSSFFAGQNIVVFYAILSHKYSVNGRKQTKPDHKLTTLFCFSLHYTIQTYTADTRIVPNVNLAFEETYGALRLWGGDGGGNKGKKLKCKLLPD